MAAVSSKAKKRQTKPPKSRPQATSSLSQPAVEDAWSSTILSVFSPSADLFALLSLAVDKHRLRVYDVNVNRVVFEHVVNGARVTSLAWIKLNATESSSSIKKNDVSPSRKRKKVDNETASSATPNATPDILALALGLSNGKVQIFSIDQGRVLKTLSDNMSSAPIVAVLGANDLKIPQCIWTSSADGTLRLWDVQKGEILSASQGGTPYTALASRPGVEHMLAANTTIQLLSTDFIATNPTDSSNTHSPKQLCTFSGHASAVKALRWDFTSSPPKRFFSSAEEDRFVYIWEISDSDSAKGKMVASCPLDTEVRQIESSSLFGKQLLLILSSSGKITLSPVPAELMASSSHKSSSKQQIPTLLPRSTISLAEKKSTADVHVLSASFIPSSEGSIRIALLSGGVRLAFETVKYLDDTREFISEFRLQPKGSLFEASKEANGSGIDNRRYKEPNNIGLVTGEQASHDPTLDAAVEREVEGALDTELAELTLGERLAARTGVPNVTGQRSSGSDAEENLLAKDSKSRSSKKKKHNELTVPAHSLTRMLIQALHSLDNGLLESCLTHSDELLIRNTVTRLPSQLAVPLLNACVERLGRGSRGNNAKGRGSGASAQRGMALIKWVKAVLTIHSGHLMTMPDLVARLAALHSTLSTRLTLQDRLLALSGRLELVLSQVELRSMSAPAPLPTRAKKSKKVKNKTTTYIEGESTDDSEEEEAGIEEQDSDDAEGSIEDIELGGNSDEDNEDEESESNEEDEVEDNEDSEDNLMNGFIDDEAEEDYDEDESDEDSD